MDKPFHIFKFTHEVINDIVKTPPAPHRHDHEEIIIATEGNYEHFIDFNKSTYLAPSLVYVAQGKVHQFLPNFSTKGWAIRYNTEFIPGGKFHYYSHYLDNIKYDLDKGFFLKSVDNLCNMMLGEIQQKTIDYDTIKYLLNALFSKLESLGNKGLNIKDTPNNGQIKTFNDFLKLLEDNYKSSEGVDFYAGKMFMSVRNLNLISKNISNKSISDIIETRKLIEARQLLIDTNKSVSEIGYELGYSEKSYFTRVFHAKTGLTPSRFREKTCSSLAK
jgi:AraC-like DNA-binding protein